jgi:hypothetical protein
MSSKKTIQAEAACIRAMSTVGAAVLTAVLTSVTSEVVPQWGQFELNWTGVKVRVCKQRISTRAANCGPARISRIMWQPLKSSEGSGAA